MDMIAFNFDDLDQNKGFQALTHCFYPYCSVRDAKIEVGRLENIAANKVLSTATCLAEVLENDIVPNNVFRVLLKKALISNDSAAVDALIKSWPFPVFRLREELGPYVFAADAQIEDTPFLSDSVNLKRRFNLSLVVVRAFLDALRLRASCKIKVLDLRDFPLDDTGINFLSCHGLLAHCEHQRNEIMRVINDAARQNKVPADEAAKFGSLNDVENYIPEDSYAIIVDCFVSKANAFKNLCKILTIGKFETCQLKIFVDKIRLSYGMDVAAKLVLELIDKKTFRCFGAANMTIEAFEPFFEYIQPMSSQLTCLDVGSDWTVDIESDPHLSTQMVDVFKMFTNLKRLNLFCCSIRRQAKKLLSALPSGLVYLNLNMCGLAETDLIYLCNSHHCATLEELILDANPMGSSTSTLCCLLKNCRNTLRVLSLEKCFLKDDQAERLFFHLGSMERLEWANLNGNKFSREKMVEGLKAVLECKSLNVLWLPYPPGDFVSPTPNDLTSEENQKALMAFIEEFDGVLQGLVKERMSKTNIKCAKNFV